MNPSNFLESFPEIAKRLEGAPLATYATRHRLGDAQAEVGRYPLVSFRPTRVIGKFPSSIDGQVVVEGVFRIRSN